MNEKEDFVADWYLNHYNNINSSAIPGSISSTILHKLIERKFKSNKGLSILEVGTNRGEHIPFVKNDYSSYLATDLVLNPGFNLANQPNVRFEVANLMQLPYPDETFDRVISTCVFHHLSDPDKGLRELRRVTKNNGRISILVPNDPGVMYRFLRSLTTLRKAKKVGLYFEAQLVHAIEHKNHFLSIQTFINWVFEVDEIEKDNFPLGIDSYNLNALTCFTIHKSGKV